MKYQWLHYDVAQDAVRCFVCCKVMKHGEVRIRGRAAASFLTNGFRNWKDASAKFAKYECSDFHKTCAQALPSTVNIGDMLNKQAMTEKQNR